MDRRSPAPTTLIERLGRLDPAEPHPDKAAIERAFRTHFRALGLRSRTMLWAPDPEAGHLLARSAPPDSAYARAWAAVSDDAERAIRNAAGLLRGIVFLLLGLALVGLALPALPDRSPGAVVLFAFGVLVLRPAVLLLSSLAVVSWREWEDFGTPPRVADILDDLADGIAFDDRKQAAAIGFSLLFGIVPAILLTGPPAALVLAAGVMLVACLVAAWIGALARIAAATTPFLARPFRRPLVSYRRPPPPTGVSTFSAVLLSVVLAGIVVALPTATPLGMAYAIAGAFATWSLAAAAFRAIGPDAARGPSPSGTRVFGAVLIVAPAGILAGAAVMNAAWLAAILVAMLAVLGWMGVVAIARRLAGLVHAWDIHEDRRVETTLVLIRTILIAGAGLVVFTIASGRVGALVVGIGLTFAGGACGCVLARIAAGVVVLLDIDGSRATERATVAAAAAIGDPALGAVRAIVGRPVRSSARNTALEAIRAVGEAGRARTLRRKAIIRRAAAWSPLVKAYEAGLMLHWFTRGAVVCVLRPPLALADGRLHRAEGPAVRWPSGAATWFWRGVEVPGWVIEEPERLTIAAIREERNQEVRRSLAEIYGLQRYLRDAGGRLIHEDSYGKLWEIRVGREVWRVVEVMNATPEPDGSHRTYTLDVTGAEHLLGWRIDTARAAVAATYGLRPEDYGPDVRT